MIRVLFITDVVPVFFFLSIPYAPSSFTVCIICWYSWSCLKSKENSYWGDWDELFQ